jgi:ATP-dependent Clp protease ATP-binding subunit ClpX
VIQQRSSEAGGIGFGAKVKSVERKADIGQVLAQVEPEDLIKYGLIPEFVGRLPVVATLEELDEPALMKILTEPKNAITKQFRKLFEMEGVELEIRPDALAAIAKQGAEAKDRCARSAHDRRIRAARHHVRLPSLENVSKVVVDESVIEHKSEPYLIYQSAPAPAKAASAD